MTLAMLAFTLEDFTLKKATEFIPLSQLLIICGILGSLFFISCSRYAKEPIFYKDSFNKTLIIRSIFEIMGRIFYALAIAFMPITNAASILQATPLVVVLGAVIFLNEKVGWRRWTAILTGFIGVLMIIQPGTDGFTIFSIFAVLGMVGFAGRDLATRMSPVGMSNYQLGSFGFYMGSSIDLFEQDIISVFEGKAIENILPRLQAIIEGTSGNKFTTDPAMNDLLIANTHQYAPSKYHVRRGSKNKEQHSSGLLFSTWFGQGAWFRHVLNKDEFETIRARHANGQEQSHYFVVARDIPHHEREEHSWAWLDWTNEATNITSDMHRGYVVPDGWDEVHFNRGATITVNLDAPPLHLYTFRKTMTQVLEESLE